MGLDGGTIISRTDVLRGASWRVASRDAGARSTRGGQVADTYVASKEGASAADTTAARWSACALTGEPLRAPVVACLLGNLYNRESVVKLLLGRKGVFADDAAKWQYTNMIAASNAWAHLQSLKDVFQLQPTAPATNSGVSEHFTITWQCPVTGIAATSGQPMAAVRGCGHVFAARTLQEVKDNTCPLCSSPYEPADIITLNGSKEQVEARYLQLAVHQVKNRKGTKRRRDAVS